MKALALLSGGFDSAVAIYLMKNKLEIDALHFSLEPFTNDTPEKKSIELCKKLGIKNLYIINHSKEHEEIVNKCDHKYYYIISRRLMYEVAERLAKKLNCDYLLDGCNVGQVSSQTLSNLSVISQVVNIPILRPLLCYDKDQIIKLAKKIGTYELSKGPEMCNVLGPKHPATKSKLEIIEKEEFKINLNKLLEDSLKNVVFNNIINSIKKP
jgi:thiamine biosynthesis protein ThiI